jgi:hypothetical protein
MCFPAKISFCKTRLTRFAKRGTLLRKKSGAREREKKKREKKKGKKEREKERRRSISSVLMHLLLFGRLP